MTSVYIRGAAGPTRAPVPDDAELLRRVAARDASALDVLYRRHEPFLRNFLARRLSQRELIDDVLHETMLVVWERAGTFRGESQLGTWLCGIAYRLALRTLRRREATATTVPVEDAELRDDQTPEASYSTGERAALVRRALESLSPSHRAVVELTYFAGLGYPEIAARLQCPLGTVKTRMMHARARLRLLLEGSFTENQS